MNTNASHQVAKTEDPRRTTGTKLHPVTAPAILLAIMLAAVGSRAVAHEGDSHAGSAPLAHSDHAPRHRGVLLMNGDSHFEVVIGFNGGHAIYFSDAHRRPLAAGAVNDAAITVLRDNESEERVLLAPSKDGAWTGSGRAIDQSELTVRVAYSMRGDERPYWIDVTISRDQPIAHHHH